MFLLLACSSVKNKKNTEDLSEWSLSSEFIRPTLMEVWFPCWLRAGVGVGVEIGLGLGLRFRCCFLSSITVLSLCLLVS